MLARLKAKAAFLANTPLHPQWLLLDNSRQLKKLIGAITPGSTVLDVGCFNKWARNYLPDDCAYTGLDYFETATDWYGSIPDVYGDALALPLAPDSFDCALLLDVMEHIEDTEKLLGQLQQTIKPGGQLIVSVPFLYPIHDAPRDFVRPTLHGLHDLAARTGFSIASLRPIGTPITTATMLANIALTKTAINWLDRRSLWTVLAPFCLLAIPVNNLLARLVAFFETEDAFMANSYHVVFLKPDSTTVN